MKLSIALMPLSLPLIASLTISCAGDNAGQLRELRPTTIAANFGPGLSLEHRPQKNLGLNVYGHNSGGQLNSGSADLWDALEDEARNYKERGIDLGLAGSFYPFETSAFRLGLGLENHSSKVSFDSNTVDVDSYGFVKVTKTQYSQTSNFLAIPIGWSWIWDSGFSLALDFGPRIRLSRSTHWTNAGGTRVDANFRDRYRNEKEDDRNLQFGGSAGFGYSF